MITEIQAKIKTLESLGVQLKIPTTLSGLIVSDVHLSEAGHLIFVLASGVEIDVGLITGASGVGVPAGGTDGQILAKASGDDYDLEFIDPPTGGESGAPTIATQEEAEAGTDNTKMMTPLRVNEAIQALAPSGGLAYQNAIDEPPVSPSVWDDEFNGSVLDEKWSWVNQGTTGQTFRDGAARLDVPPAGGISLRTLIQNAPTVPFSVISKLRMYTDFVNSQNSGIVLYNSVTGKYVTCVLGINASSTTTGIIKWSSYSGYDSDARVSIDRYRYSLYLKMSYKAGIVTTYWSPDGVEWFQSASQDVSGFIGTPDQIGVYGNSENSSIGEVSYFDWFRVTEE